jgi:AcrR family transcriptional regulator
MLGPMRALPGSRSEGDAGRALSREEMAGEQRRRILKATAELVAEHGYLGFRVDQLLSRAEVSLPTVRKRFGDREGCYLALFDRAAAEATRRSAEAFEAQGGSGPQKLAAAIGALFELLAAHPDIARACLIEPFAVGAAAIGCYERALEELGAMLRLGRGGGGEARGLPATLEEELAAAVLWLPSQCLLAGEAGRIPELAPRTVEFVLAPYLEHRGRRGSQEPPSSPRVEARAAPEPRSRAQATRQPDLLGPLPAGKHKLPREVVERNQRERLLAAIAAAVAERGYAATRVTDVVRKASVSRRVFYANFETTEQCFLAAWDIVVGHLRELASGAAAGHEGDTPQQVIAALRAVLGFFAAEPRLARFCMVESLAAGPLAAKRYREAVGPIAIALRASLAASTLDSPAPEATEELLVGSVATTLSLRIATEGVEHLPMLAPELAAFLLGPYLGSVEAGRIARETTDA